MFILQAQNNAQVAFPDINTTLSQWGSYLTDNLLPNAIAGDPASLTIAVIGSIIAFIILFKLSGVLYAIIKRVFLFVIVGFSLYFILMNFESKLALEGVSTQLIIFGLIGVALGLLALVKTVWAIKHHAKKETREEIKATPPFQPTQIQQPKMLTTQGFSASNILDELKSDRSLLSVLSYVIVAEFGVFSSVTQAAPTVEAGAGIAIAFFIGAFVFIRTTYHDYKKGIRHLVIASVFAFALSILLGVYWTGRFTFEVLLSLDYFMSPSLVALLTGIAVSLFMGSKN